MTWKGWWSNNWNWIFTTTNWNLSIYSITAIILSSGVTWAHHGLLENNYNQALQGMKVKKWENSKYPDSIHDRYTEPLLPNYNQENATRCHLYYCVLWSMSECPGTPPREWLCLGIFCSQSMNNLSPTARVWRLEITGSPKYRVPLGGPRV